jgi:Rad3-related DNA helicase
MINEPLYCSFPPDFEPNEAQDYILSEIDIAISEGKKFIIINAPTATGKSFIAKTLANHSNYPTQGFVSAVNSYQIYDNDDPQVSEEDLEPFGAAILTVTKSLQDQYASMFEDGSTLKGKANYECAINNMYNCDNGICTFTKGQMKKCLSCDKCPYFTQRNEAATNICSFYNYAMFESLPEIIKNKEFIICDEASELEAELVGRYTIEINMKDLRKVSEEYPISPSMDASRYEVYEWVAEMARTCEYEYNSYMNHINKELKDRAKKKRLNKEETQKLSLLKRYKDAFATIRDAWTETDFIISHTKNGLLFQPYNVDKLADRIFRYGKIIILMSATIVNPKKFAETLGIKDYYFIETATTLSAKKAPIKCASKFRLNYKNKDILLPTMAKAAKQICKMFPDKKGIIHTHSMDVLKYLRAELEDDDRFLFREQGVDNERMLQIHQSTKMPTVLVSPSMTHGVDLKGDLGEFQIVMKAPFLPLNDERVKRKFENDKEWYTDAMLSTLIQMCGRCNRTESDYSETFILDGMILDAVLRNKEKLPKYFLDRFI